MRGAVLLMKVGRIVIFFKAYIINAFFSGNSKPGFKFSDQFILIDKFVDKMVCQVVNASALGFLMLMDCS